MADLPNPAAARGTGRRPNGRGYQRRYGQIEDALRKKKTVGEVYQGFGASLAGRFGANLASRPPRTPGGSTLATKTITKGEARGAGGAPTKRGMATGAVYFRAPSERSAPLCQNIPRFYRFFGETRLRDTPQKSRGNLPP